MNLTEIQKKAVELYGSVFSLEDLVSHKKRRFYAEIFLILSFLVFVGAVILYGAENFAGFNGLESIKTRLFGAGYIFLSIWIMLFSSNAFFYSYYFMRPSEKRGLFIDLDLAYVFFKLSPQDIVGSFFSSILGSRFMLRTGIKTDDLNTFLKNRIKLLTVDDFVCDSRDNIIDLVDFSSAIYDSDLELQKFLFEYGIQKKEWLSIAMWIMEIHANRHNLEGWWSKDNLQSISSIGQSFSYGEAYTLKKYERHLPFGSSQRYGVHTSYGENEYKELQSVLVKNRQGNAILVSDDFSGQLQLIARLKQDINNNLSLETLKGKKVSILDVEALTSSTTNKSAFESELLKILNEAEYAGNMIIVIDNLPAFVASIASFGSDLSSLLDQYLASPVLKIVALASVDLYHSVIEKNGVFMQSFETILIKEVDDLNTVKILQNEIIKYESRGMLFTYLSLVEMVKSAVRYFPNAAMPDKAIDILSEIVPKLESVGKMIVEKSDVQKLVEDKTGIPVGDVKSDERKKLLNLESILSSKIIGQKEAITAISNAMRKSRSGIENPNKPLGSFLFLGPTGVGKTETTKALSEVFFGSSSYIGRLDMSEYSSFDSLEKLIGSFETGKPGVLSSMVREHPYGVLLLDEFEKTTKEVMNLFLQILDEGFFSDGSGKKVIARNLIIIATSNAGSSLIWETMKLGKSLTDNKESIIDSIIKERIYSPELLNRFDAVVLFHPLTEENIRDISKISLNKLKERLAEQGINLVVNDELVEFVSSKGTDPKFGARPINRAISDEIEQIIAKKIISGTVSMGSQVTIKKEDLSGVV